MDGVADVETPAVFVATIQHEGPPRPNVQVTLTIDGVEVGSETIDLEGGQSREVTFKYRFDAGVEPGKSAFVPAKVSIPPDHLEGDDFRVLSVPVVAALPVVFVDQYGPDEDRKRNRYGETLHLRRLLAPVTSRADSARQLVEIRHLKIDQLDRDVLKDARLVVIAGVANPEGAVDVLRDYVKQGGQLVIAAGADFDPAQWNEAAWLDGPWHSARPAQIANGRQDSGGDERRAEAVLHFVPEHLGQRRFPVGQHLERRTRRHLRRTRCFSRPSRPTFPSSVKDATVSDRGKAAGRGAAGRGRCPDQADPLVRERSPGPADRRRSRQPQ